MQLLAMERLKGLAVEIHEPAGYELNDPHS